VGHHRKRSSVGDAEFAVDSVELNLHGTFREPKPAADFLIRNSLGEFAHNLALALGQFELGFLMRVIHFPLASLAKPGQ